MTRPREHAAAMWQRYLRPELFTTTVVVASGIATFALNRSLAAMVIVTGLVETAGFYGYAAVRAAREASLIYQSVSRLKRIIGIVAGTILSLLGEHLLAEAVDAPLRPVATYFGGWIALHVAGGTVGFWQLMATATIGLIVSRLAADLVFYPLSHFSRHYSARIVAWLQGRLVQWLQPDQPTYPVAADLPVSTRTPVEAGVG